jgi:hypothetical protein
LMVFSVFHTNDLTRYGGSVFLRFLEPVLDSSGFHFPLELAKPLVFG